MAYYKCLSTTSHRLSMILCIPKPTFIHISTSSDNAPTITIKIYLEASIPAEYSIKSYMIKS